MGKFWLLASGRRYSEACRQLAKKLGYSAVLNKDSRVYDCSFGCGDQLALWYSVFSRPYTECECIEFTNPPGKTATR